MKRAFGIYREIYSLENLQLAFYKAGRGRRQKQEVITFCRSYSQNLNQIREQLRTLRFDLGHYNWFTIYDPKKRRICAAPFRERIIHHALINQTESYFEKKQIFDSYACRKGKGQHRALLRALSYFRKYPVVLQLDIRKYFDSIGHKILLRQLGRCFKDPDLLYFFSEILASYHTEEGRGLPIGNLSSQFLANHYLAGFDHFIKEKLRIPGYVRFMDDMLFFGKSRAVLENQFMNIDDYLREKLQLDLKKKLLLSSSQGCDFLGFRVNKNGIFPSKKSKKRFKSKCYQIKRLIDVKGQLDQQIISKTTTLFSWLAFSRSRNYRKKIIREVLQKG